MGYPNKLLLKVMAACWTSEPLHRASDIWRGQGPDPRGGRCLAPDRWVPTFPTSLPFFMAAQSPPGCDQSSLFTTQMNFNSRNSPSSLSLQTLAWCPPQESRPQSIHHFTWLHHEPTTPHDFPVLTCPSCILEHARGCESLFLPAEKHPTFLFLGSLAENQISNKGAKALARSLMVNRSLTMLE